MRNRKHLLLKELSTCTRKQLNLWNCYTYWEVWLKWTNNSFFFFLNRTCGEKCCGCCFTLRRSILQSQSTIPWKTGISATLPTPLPLTGGCCWLQEATSSMAMSSPIRSATSTGLQTPSPLPQFGITLKSHPSSCSPRMSWGITGGQLLPLPSPACFTPWLQV